MGALHTLPASATSFVGRQAEIAHARKLLETFRVVTLVGPGGCGKSRLALEAAVGLTSDFPAGLCLVDLAALRDGAEVPGAVVDALRLAHHPERTAEANVFEALAGARLLMVLDNCEHLVEAIAAFADRLLATCPYVRILATSREPIKVHGEARLQVPPLELPDLDQLTKGAAIAGVESVRLLLDRARMTDPSFELTHENVLPVAKLCCALDGIPLAIELAAARLSVLSPQQLLERIERSLDVLVGGARRDPPRQKSLEATVDWSHRLLDDEERTLFRRLSVFRGGFTLEAAEAVCASAPLELTSILGVLSRLIEKSMIVSIRGRNRRFRCLEPLRKYGFERLREANEEQVLGAKHMDWLLHLADGSGGDSVTVTERLERMEVELGNLRSALDWARKHDLDRGLRLATAFPDFWVWRSHEAEGRAWLERFLAAASPSQDSQAAALIILGRLAWRQADETEARRYLEEAVAVARQAGDTGLIGSAVGTLGFVLCTYGDVEGAGLHLEEQFRLAAESEDGRRIGQAAADLGHLAVLVHGDMRAARPYLLEAIRRARENEDRFGLARADHLLSAVAVAETNLAEARQLQEEGLRIRLELGDRGGVSFVLDSIAIRAAAERQFERALRLSAAASALRGRVRFPVPRDWRAFTALRLANARRAVGHRAAGRADAQGRALSFDQSVAYALGDETFATGTVALGRGTTITKRESHVARLVAQRLTNAQIAVRLGLSERTVDAHLEHIRNKLGVRSRAQVAAWAVDFNGAD